MHQRLTPQQQEKLRRLGGISMESVNDADRDELVRLGLVEMKLGGWGLTAEGRRRALFG